MKSYCKGVTIGEEEVRAGFADWLSAPSGRKNAWRVDAENGGEDALVAEICREVGSRTLSFNPIRRYVRAEGSNGKLRTIGVESVKQQVCDHVATLLLAPLLDAKVGFWQVASVRGKGQEMARRACARHCRRYRYHLHVDVRKCYQSTSTGVAMRVLRRYVRSADVLYLCETLLATYGGCLEIGSYLSLRLSQLVLSFGYHHIESLRGGRRGRSHALVSRQLWYADDVFLFADSKRGLRVAARSLERYLHDGFGLSLKPWKVCQCGDGEPVDCVGYRVRPRRTTLRRTLFLRAMRAFRRFRRRGGLKAARTAISYWGWVKHTDSRSLVARRGLNALIASAKEVVARHGRMVQACTQA